jgi:hypothetical protein
MTVTIPFRAKPYPKNAYQNVFLVFDCRMPRSVPLRSSYKNIPAFIIDILSNE